MSQTTEARERWVVQYRPCDDAPWIWDEAFPLLCFQDAEAYLQQQRKRRPGVQWRLMRRHTVTTVTEEVVRYCEPERRVSYFIEQTPKNKQDWEYVETWPDKDQAARRIAVLRETQAGSFWDFRLTQVDAVRTVIG
jgi:hypothetical protein